MHETLIIFLQGKNLEPPSWAIHNGLTIVDSVMQGDPQSLAALANNRRVVVLVPSEDTLLLAADLPNMSRSQLKQAIPYALEDQLTADIETLHFAYETAMEETRPLPVLVVSQERMSAWITLLQSWNIQPDNVTTNLFALPYAENNWHIFIYENQALVRLNQYQGFACETNNLSALLSLALTSSAAPENILVNCYGQDIEVVLGNIPVIIQQHMTYEFIKDIAANFDHAVNVNLLQGNFAARKTKRWQQDKLRKCLKGVVCLWLVVLLAYPIVSYLILHSRATRLEQKMLSIYKRNFPQATNMVAPKLRLQEKLQRLTSSVGQNQFLLLMGYFTHTMTNIAGVQLKKLNYQHNQLLVDITAQNSDVLSTLLEKLKQQGLTVKQQSATLIDQTIQATLAIN